MVSPDHHSTSALSLSVYEEIHDYYIPKKKEKVMGLKWREGDMRVNYFQFWMEQGT